MNSNSFQSAQSGPADRRQLFPLPVQPSQLETEKALLCREHELSDFLQNASEGIHQVALSGKILWANKAELNLLGYAPEEYIGHDIREFHADPEVIADILTRLARGETLDCREARVRHKDGSIRYVSLCSSMYREGGQLLYSRCFSRDITKTKAAEQELKRAHEQHLADLRAITLLYEVNNECIRAGAQITPCLQRVLDAAIAITGAANGNIQLLEPSSGKLVIAVQHGFKAPFLQFFASVGEEQVTACATAKRTRERLVIEDITTSPIFAGQPVLQVLLAAGVRAVQSTPLVSSAGAVLGMISTHFAAPHTMGERESRLLDLLARQAADYLERKRTGEGLALLAAIVENSDDAIITKNLDGLITSWNKAAERIFGYTAEETVGQHISLLIPPERLDEEPGILARLRQGERIEHFETVRRRKDGTLLDISLTVSPVRDPAGKIIGASKIARDVTELRMAREALARSHQQLEQRVAERTASLEEAIVQMEDFTYSVSHDLRAPARVIRGLAEAAIEDYGPSMPLDLRTLLSKISGSAERMEQLIRDILNYSKIARAEVNPSVVDLEHLVRKVVADSPEMQPPKAAIRVASPLQPVLAHEPYLSQAVTNLLANAVKFVPLGAEPQVELWTERRNGFVRLWVKDHGIGIPPKYQHSLFQLFQRVHDSARYEGTGVGLAIVRKAAEKMGGKVGVISDGATGSSFWMELPAVVS